jgi:hypothetical protein
MSTVDTVNHVREINTNLPTITIPTDAGQSFELPALTYREHLALTTNLLIDICDHSHTAKHQSASAGSVIRQITFDAEANLQAEKAEDERIERELKEEAEGK